MGRITWVIAQFRFIGIHHWPGAPPNSVLRHPHRHEFHVKVSLTVTHNDREIEFQSLKDDMSSFLEEQRGYMAPAELIRWSCEDYAMFILEHLEAKYPERSYRVSVFEDGENGAEIECLHA